MARPTNEELNSLKQELESLITSGNELISNLQNKDSEFSSAVENISTQLNTAQENSNSIETSKQTIHGITTEIEDIKNTVINDFKKIQKLSKQSSEISETISNQESTLKQLSVKAEELKQTIEDLLPGATSAGLASAFKDRKESFKIPKILWGSVFVLSVIALFLVAYIDPVSFEKTTLNFEIIFQNIFIKLPFVVPIVWLAIYAGRRHSQALRLEEDYAHKEVLSKSFEGYKNQLIEIEVSSDKKQSTLNLIDRTLEALSLHPGRIYQGKHEDITPLNSVASALTQKKEVNNENQA